MPRSPIPPKSAVPPIRIKEPMMSLRRRYEYNITSSDRPLTMGEGLTEWGADGWRCVGVFVRFDTVHVIFEREVTG